MRLDHKREGADYVHVRSRAAVEGTPPIGIVGKSFVRVVGRHP
jgi:hypothetical protein